MKQKNSIKKSDFQKKVLHVTGGMNRGGAETMIMNIYRNIDHDKVQFDFISITNSNKCDFDEDIQKLGGGIYYLKPFNPIFPWKFINNLVRIIKNNGPYQAIHAHTLFNIGWVVKAAKIAGIEIRIAHAHSTRDTLKDSRTRRLYQDLMKSLILRNSTSLVACGLEAGQYLFGENFSKKGIVIPNAVNLEDYLSISTSEIDSLKNDLDIGNETLIIGQVGNLKEVKNHHFSLLIARELADLEIDFKIFFVGDGELKEKLASEVKEKGLSQYVEFLGMRSDIPKLLNVFDLFIMPSLYEGLPLALIEAQAAGRSCIVSKQITKEADLGIGIVKFLDLNDPEQWVREILNYNKKEQEVDIFSIKQAFKVHKYDVKSNSNIYVDLYNLRRTRFEEF
ncbi:glycosyltransferase family 1 protein [Heyndrickxia sp. MSNUG]|uniref:glycosyltransferase family 1 protein n=1 Tax=Heyndrickxia sp. MSNUG TaxID=3136677 RepID=UPI003C2B6680